MKQTIELEKDKKSIFIKFRKFINILYKIKNKIKKNNKYDEKISKFDDFLLEIDKKSDAYLIAKNIINFCEKGIIVAKKRILIENKIQTIQEEISSLKCYKDLSYEGIKELENLVLKFISLNKDKNDLRSKISTFDKGMLEIEKLKKDIDFILNNVEEAERKKRILNHDIGFLKGEKLDLEYEREELINLRNIVSKFYIFTIIISSIIFVILGFLRIFKGNNILLFTFTFSILIILITVGIYLLKSKIRKELIINLKKQHKAVELLNKKNTVYVYYNNFLDFIYNKYNVKSVNKLKQNIKEYEMYKNTILRFDSIKDSLYKIEEEIENFLKLNKIENSIITIEKFAKTINIENKLKYYEDLYTEKTRLEKKLSKLDKIYEEIWNRILSLSKNNKDINKLIDNIIEKYLNEISKLININNDFENKEEIFNIFIEDNIENIDK